MHVTMQAELLGNCERCNENELTILAQSNFTVQNAL